MSVNKLKALENEQRRTLPPFGPGDSVEVHYRVREGDKERTQVFKGTVIRKGNQSIGATFTVRKVSFSVGVERIFPMHSPRIEKLAVTAKKHVRRAKLFYLRELEGKESRLRQSQAQRTTEDSAS